MNIFSWVMMWMMRREAKKMAALVRQKYPEAKKRLPNTPEEKVIRSMVFEEEKYEKLSDRAKNKVRTCCKNVNGFCYLMSLDLGSLKGSINLRSLQFTTMMDQELIKAGFPKQSYEQKKEILEVMDLAIPGWAKITGDSVS